MIMIMHRLISFMEIIHIRIYIYIIYIYIIYTYSFNLYIYAHIYTHTYIHTLISGRTPRKHFFFFKRKGWGGAEREPQIESTPSTKPDAGLNPTTLRP